MAMARFGDVVNCRGFEGASWAFEIDLMSLPISTQLEYSSENFVKVFVNYMSSNTLPCDVF